MTAVMYSNIKYTSFQAYYFPFFSELSSNSFIFFDSSPINSEMSCSSRFTLSIKIKSHAKTIQSIINCPMFFLLLSRLFDFGHYLCKVFRLVFLFIFFLYFSFHNVALISEIGIPFMCNLFLCAGLIFFPLLKVRLTSSSKQHS